MWVLLEEVITKVTVEMLYTALVYKLIEYKDCFLSLDLPYYRIISGMIGNYICSLIEFLQQPHTIGILKKLFLFRFAITC